MPRNLTSTQITNITSNVVCPVFLASIAFSNETVYAWTGVGPLVWNGNTYQGVGQFGSVSPIQESNDVTAQGIILTLSGIPTNLMDDSLSNIQFGQLAQVYLGFWSMSGGALIGDPIPAFIGLVDQPTIDVSTDTVKISISVESRLADMQRAPGGRYTDQDQRARYPNDGSLKWVQYIQDIHLPWGSG
jgi:hypothetical protein